MVKHLIDIKIRQDGAAALRELAAHTNIKMADVVSLWPRCPQCGFLLQRVSNKLMVCPSCGMEYKLC